MSAPIILHVEDDVNDALLLERAVRRANLSVNIQRVENGHSAIAYLEGAGPYADRAAHSLPGLVLLDIKLPGLHGFEVLSWIRLQSRFAHLPVVMLSSSDEPSDIQEATRLGANCYIVKRTGFQDVLNFISTLHGRGGAGLADEPPAPAQRWWLPAQDGSFWISRLPGLSWSSAR